MFGRKKTEHPVISVTLDQVRKAVREYAKELPKGVTRAVLVKKDNSIDFEPLVPYLKGIPDRKFYMSKETYEIFEEHEKEIPKYLDMVQQAVDAYIRYEKMYPVVEGDPNKKISYYHLERKGYLKERPPLDFYLTEEESLITHRISD